MPKAKTLLFYDGPCKGKSVNYATLGGYIGDGFPFSILVEGQPKPDIGNRVRDLCLIISDLLCVVVEEYEKDSAADPIALPNNVIKLARMFFEPFDKQTLPALSVMFTYKNGGYCYCAGFGWGDALSAIYHPDAKTGPGDPGKYTTVKPVYQESISGSPESAHRIAVFSTVKLQPGDQLIQITKAARKYLPQITPDAAFPSRSCEIGDKVYVVEPPYPQERSEFAQGATRATLDPYRGVGIEQLFQTIKDAESEDEAGVSFSSIPFMPGQAQKEALAEAVNSDKAQLLADLASEKNPEFYASPYSVNQQTGHVDFMGLNPWFQEQFKVLVETARALNELKPTKRNHSGDQERLIKSVASIKRECGPDPSEFKEGFSSSNWHHEKIVALIQAQQYIPGFSELVDVVYVSNVLRSSSFKDKIKKVGLPFDLNQYFKVCDEVRRIYKRFNRYKGFFPAVLQQYLHASLMHLAIKLRVIYRDFQGEWGRFYRTYAENLDSSRKLRFSLIDSLKKSILYSEKAKKTLGNYYGGVGDVGAESIEMIIEKLEEGLPSDPSCNLVFQNQSRAELVVEEEEDDTFKSDGNVSVQDFLKSLKEIAEDFNAIELKYFRDASLERPATMKFPKDLFPKLSDMRSRLYLVDRPEGLSQLIKIVEVSNGLRFSSLDGAVRQANLPFNIKKYFEACEAARDVYHWFRQIDKSNLLEDIKNCLHATLTRLANNLKNTYHVFSKGDQWVEMYKRHAESVGVRRQGFFPNDSYQSSFNERMRFSYDNVLNDRGEIKVHGIESMLEALEETPVTSGCTLIRAMPFFHRSTGKVLDPSARSPGVIERLRSSMRFRSGFQ